MDLLCVVRSAPARDEPLAWQLDATAVAANLHAAVAELPQARLHSVATGCVVSSITDAFGATGSGDAIYLVEDDYVHRPGALAVLVEGLRETDADYVTLYDEPHRYWRQEDGRDDAVREAVEPLVAVSASCHWLVRSSLPGSFGARRATLERDLPMFARLTDPVASLRWPALWARLRAEHGRVLRGACPAYATSAACGSVAPCFPPPEERDRTAVASAPEGFDLWRNRDLTGEVAVLPGVSEACREGIAALLPLLRQVPVDSPEQVAERRFPFVVAANGEKEHLDGILRARATPVAAVIVDVTDRSTARSLRWISGRDWLLPVAVDNHWVV